MSDTPPNPAATAATIRERHYFTGTITRHHADGTDEIRQLDSRWTSRQIRWCRDNYDNFHPDQLMAAGTTLENARLSIAPDTFIVFWALAGVAARIRTPDFEDLLDLRSDQVMDQFTPVIDWHTPETEAAGGDEPDDPTDGGGNEP